MSERKKSIVAIDGPAGAGKSTVARVVLDGEDISGFIRTPEISQGASKVSAVPRVRAALLEMQRAADRVYVDPALYEYAVRLATATRNPEKHGLQELNRYITFGASPRASINLILTGRALAYVRGRDYALPEDVLDMALDVLRHRLVLSFEALSDDVSSDSILRTILGRIPVPVVPLRDHDGVRVSA
ncbi:MAG TPA: hypothetical protein VMS65_00695 [Polyangiaceae bacterium]|nr:hypothetical protein [Polyangiaceae bacterium]